jgi:hypothetical protein
LNELLGGIGRPIKQEAPDSQSLGWGCAATPTPDQFDCAFTARFGVPAGSTLPVGAAAIEPDYGDKKKVPDFQGSVQFIRLRAPTAYLRPREDAHRVIQINDHWYLHAGDVDGKVEYVTAWDQRYQQRPR